MIAKLTKFILHYTINLHLTNSMFTKVYLYHKPYTYTHRRGIRGDEGGLILDHILVLNTTWFILYACTEVWNNMCNTATVYYENY